METETIGVLGKEQPVVMTCIATLYTLPFLLSIVSAVAAMKLVRAFAEQSLEDIQVRGGFFFFFFCYQYWMDIFMN